MLNWKSVSKKLTSEIQMGKQQESINQKTGSGSERVPLAKIAMMKIENFQDLIITEHILNQSCFPTSFPRRVNKRLIPNRHFWSVGSPYFSL